MNIEYDPRVDIFHIGLFGGGSYDVAGAEDTKDEDVILHYDTEGRLAEIEVYHASERVKPEILHAARIEGTRHELPEEGLRGVTFVYGGTNETAEGPEKNQGWERVLKETDRMERLGADGGGWETLYRDPDDGRFWKLTFPKGHLHGGGPPALILVSIDEVYDDFFLVPKSESGLFPELEE